MTPAQLHDALANGLTAQDIEDQEAEDEEFERMERESRPAPLLPLKELTNEQKKQPKAGRPGAVRCELRPDFQKAGSSRGSAKGDKTRPFCRRRQYGPHRPPAAPLRPALRRKEINHEHSAYCARSG